MHTRFHLALLSIALILTGCATTPHHEVALRRSLTFHASFDQGPDADHARGDARLYTADAMNKRDSARPGLHGGTSTVLLPAGGRFGGALRFNQKEAPVVFYRAANNLPYTTNRWSGTVSFWLQADPAGELAEGFCDPLQITPRAWNDGAFFVEFEKRQTIPFRLGVYADFTVWNPQNRKWEQIPAHEKPLLTIPQPPFAKGKWTHVVFTFENFNTGRSDGVARLYLDGQLQGVLDQRTQTFTWDISKTAVMPGLGYIGSFDDLAIFDRALGAEEVAVLFALPSGVKDLH